MRGGDTNHKTVIRWHLGRSPRARGRLRRTSPVRHRDRSIPACAGETLYPLWMRLPAWVDPRVRGGDMPTTLIAASHLGRSPRARGRLTTTKRNMSVVGSIPACAGETKCRCWPRPVWQVDPRVRGGDSLLSQGYCSDPGRSPRARGRLLIASTTLSLTGSIPACAGETRMS